MSSSNLKAHIVDLLTFQFLIFSASPDFGFFDESVFQTESIQNDQVRITILLTTAY